MHRRKIRGFAETAMTMDVMVTYSSMLWADE